MRLLPSKVLVDPLFSLNCNGMTAKAQENISEFCLTRHNQIQRSLFFQRDQKSFPEMFLLYLFLKQLQVLTACVYCHPKF